MDTCIAALPDTGSQFGDFAVLALLIVLVGVFSVRVSRRHGQMFMVAALPALAMISVVAPSANNTEDCPPEMSTTSVPTTTVATTTTTTTTTSAPSAPTPVTASCVDAIDLWLPQNETFVVAQNFNAENVVAKLITDLPQCANEVLIQHGTSSNPHAGLFGDGFSFTSATCQSGACNGGNGGSLVGNGGNGYRGGYGGEGLKYGNGGDGGAGTNGTDGANGVDGVNGLDGSSGAPGGTGNVGGNGGVG